MFSVNNITSNESWDLAHSTTLLIDLTLGNISKFLLKDGGMCKNLHLLYKTSNISEMKQSGAKVAKECL